MGVGENFEVVARAAAALGVDPDLARAIAWAESRGHHVDPAGGVVISPTGAIGVMQLLPRTARALGIDPLNLEENSRGGVKYIRRIMERLGIARLNDNAVRAIAAAYNRGPGWDQAQPWPDALRRYTSNVVAAWHGAPWPMPPPTVAIDVVGPTLQDAPPAAPRRPAPVHAPARRWPVWVWLPVGALALLVASAGLRKGRR